MNEVELARLAAMAHALRPEWPAQSVKTYLHAFAGSAFRDVAVALAWVACDPTSATPARLAENGPWWQATRLPGMTANVPPRQDPLLVPDAPEDDPQAWVKALRDGRLVRRPEPDPARIARAAAEARRALAAAKART